jgi:hypothetical protein
MPFSDTVLQPLISLGYGLAAKFLGLPYLHYQPRSAGPVIANINALDTLYLAFDHDKNYSFEAPLDYKQNTYFALIDGTTLSIGDYLDDRQGDKFFVADMEPLKAVMLVKCNRMIDVLRPATNNGYGGETADLSVLTQWPASILTIDGIGGPNLDVDVGTIVDKGVTIYLPNYPSASIFEYDIVIDEFDRRYTVSQIEITQLGYRIAARYTTA